MSQRIWIDVAVPAASRHSPSNVYRAEGNIASFSPQLYGWFACRPEFKIQDSGFGFEFI